ncbi:hypothetical protein N9D31_00330 [Oligoflexaceae bacterium]|nr:hypothetical protein [Oligoflexaceae bacterium]
MNWLLLSVFLFSIGCVSSRKGQEKNEADGNALPKVTSSPSISSSTVIFECRTFSESSRHIYLLYQNKSDPLVGHIHSLDPIEPLIENKYSVDWESKSKTLEVEISGDEQDWMLEINVKTLKAELTAVTDADDSEKEIIREFECYDLR